MNESRTCADGGTKLTQVGSPPVRGRFRLIGNDGRAYAPFRVRPGKTLGEIVKASPGCDIEAA